MDMPNKMEGKPGVVQPDNTPNGGGAIVGGSAGGCMCSYPYKKEKEWWTDGNKIEGIFYGDCATYLGMAYKAICNAASLKGEPKPSAPCCCKCDATKRISCQAKCMKSKENEFKVMFDGHKYERSHWVWCGFACLACNFQDAPAVASCVQEEVMEREMNKEPLVGDEKHPPAWWMSIQKNMVISSQKTQGLEPDGEPCSLGFEDKSSGGGGGDGPGQKNEMAAFDAEKKEHEKDEKESCDFMCKMKKSMSSAKEKAGGVDLSKEPPVSVESMDQQIEASERLKEQEETAKAVRIYAEKADAPKRL